MVDRNYKEKLAELRIREEERGWFIVISEEDVGSVTRYRDVCRVLQINNIWGVNLIHLWRAFQKGAGAYKIADKLVLNPVSITQISCKVDSNYEKAFLDIMATPENFPSLEDIFYVLLQSNVIMGFREDLLYRIIEEKESVSNVLIASWKEPRYGEKAQLIWEIDVHSEVKPLLLDNGKVDLKSLGRYRSIHKGDIIVRKLPPTKGEDGWRINGEVLDSTGEDVPFPRGKNTRISEDNLALIAGVSGHIYLKNNLVHIDEVLVINGNVDYSIGHIDYIGEVVIRGDVLSDFNVVTSGNVMIMGTVEGGKVISREGDIQVGGGVVGYKKARLVAAKNIRAKYIQDAYVNAGEDIELERYLINCTAAAGGNVILKDTDSVIRGGVVKVGKGLEVGTIGSFSRVKTEIELGSQQDPEFLEKLTSIDEEIRTLEQKIESTERKLRFWEMLKKRLGTLNPEKNKEYFQLQQEKDEYEKNLRELKQKKNKVDVEESQLSEKIQLKIKKSIFPGSIIRVGNDEIIVDKEYQGIEFLQKILKRG